MVAEASGGSDAPDETMGVKTTPEPWRVPPMTQQPPAHHGRGRSRVLSRQPRVRHGGVTHNNEPPEFPGRFIPKIPTIFMNNHIYQKASTLVLSFGVLALATNGVQLFFFSFDELAADGVSYTKDYSGLLQGAIYLGICVALAYFIRKQNKVAAVFAGSMAAVIGLSTFWLALLSDAQNLITAVDTLEPGASFFDFFVLMYGFHVVISVISICLCIMITGTTFSAVFGKKKQP